MTQLTDIYNEYLKIEPFDTIRLEEFYLKNKDYFDNELPTDKDEQEKYFIMICEIGNSYSFSDRHVEALIVLKKVEKLFKKLQADNKINNSYNSILYCLAYSNFKQKNYFKALKYFKKYIPPISEKSNTEISIQKCKNKIRKQIYMVIGIIGFTILTIKYSIKWFFPENYSIVIQYSGILGGILLLTYGFSKTKN